MTFGVNVMANATNLFLGYKEYRPVEIIPFAGAGLYYTFEGDENPVSQDVLYKAGIRTNFNFNQKTALFVELQGYIMGREFDGYAGHAQNDGLSTLMVGLHFNINKYFPKPVDLTAQFDEMNQKINEQRGQIEAQKNQMKEQNFRINNLQAQTDSIKANCCNKKEVVVQTVEKVREITNVTYETEYIYFGINSSYFSQTESKKIDGAIAYLNSHPQTKLLVMGYADKQTGTVAYNKIISEKRVNRVVEYMTKKGIRKDRLIVQAYGDETQPEAINENNRVVILMER